MAVVEFKFPNGDFEIDTVARVPSSGEAVIRRGDLWEIDYIKPGQPPVVMLRSALEQLRSEKPSTAGA